MKKPLILLFLPLFAALLGCTLPLVWGPAPAPTSSPGPPEEVKPALTLTDVAPETTATQEIPGPEPTPLDPGPPVPSEAPTMKPTVLVEPEPFPFSLQTGSPAAVVNFAHPEFGCNWLGVGGQVFNFTGRPEQGMIVEVGGSLAGVETRLLSVTGGVTIYGEGGYEFTLAQLPVGSTQSLWIQLFGIDGEALSDKVYFDTFDDCGRNLVLINFVGLPSSAFRAYFPLLIRN